MRKITQNVVSAFLAGVPKSQGNTYTDGVNLYLHGNIIARHTNDGLMITNAGWFSNTTKERLNALPGVSISQKAFKWYLNGKAWGGEWVNVSAWDRSHDHSQCPVGVCVMDIPF